MSSRPNFIHLFTRIECVRCVCMLGYIIINNKSVDITLLNEWNNVHVSSQIHGTFLFHFNVKKKIEPTDTHTHEEDKIHIHT